MSKIVRLTVLLAVLLSALCFFTFAAGEQKAEEITKKCTITTSNSGKSKLTNGKLDDYWESKKTSSTITIALPSGKTPGGILIKWFHDFDRFEYRQYARDGSLISETDSSAYFRGHTTWLELNENAAKAEIQVYNSGKICGLQVYSAGDDPKIQKWQNPADKIDLLMIVAHQDDEELWFGGMLPYYSAVRGKNVQVVYMTSCGRKRIQESLNGLWVMGVKTVPEVIGLANKYPDTVTEAYEAWHGRDNVKRLLVQTIRKYRPEVIVTHDWDGEYGHSQHKATARVMEEAIREAADPQMYPESAELYGVWQTKKLYLHLSDTAPIYMDWTVPAEELGGKTPIAMAELGYKEHKSQQKAYSMDMGKKKYDYTKFGLVFTTVGPDVEKNDLLENTDAQ